MNIHSTSKGTKLGGAISIMMINPAIVTHLAQNFMSSKNFFTPANQELERGE